MTTALPATGMPPSLLLSGTRHLRLVSEDRQNHTDTDNAESLVGYLVLVPEGTDPAELFTPDEAHAVIRPVTRASAPPPVAPVDDGLVRIDSVRRVAEVDGRALVLTYLEFELLAHLVAHPHQVHSRRSLMASVWGYDYVGDGRTVDVHIARLRGKLGEAHRDRIVTVRRVGYTYTPDQ